MKTLLIIFLSLLPFFGMAQKGYTYVIKDGGFIDSSYEKIIGDTVLICNGRFINDKNGNYLRTEYYPSDYWIVEYNYGETPPDQFEIAKMFFTRDTICRGWQVYFKNIFDMHGYTEGVQTYLVTATNEKATFYHKTYCDTINLSYGMGEYELEFSIKSSNYIKSNNETNSWNNILIGPDAITKPRKKVVKSFKE